MRSSYIVATLFCAVVQLAHASALPELLPDGNWRDPVPDQAVIQQLLIDTEKNMVPLPAGVFEMGDWGHEVNDNGLPFDGSLDSKPLHKVKLSAFAISKYPITYAEFDIFTAALRLPRINQDDVAQIYRKPRRPAGVSWQGAKDYCSWLAKQSGKSYDLPTEAQWEYAARSGGKRYLYPTNNGESIPGENLPAFAELDRAGGVIDVGSYPPNPAGIYDFSAGLREWVNDWYSQDYYQTSPLTNPKGPATGKFHVIRGYFGSNTSAMTIKRWVRDDGVYKGTWPHLSKSKNEPNKEIPYTKYTGAASATFRCVLNH